VDYARKKIYDTCRYIYIYLLANISVKSMPMVRIITRKLSHETCSNH